MTVPAVTYRSKPGYCTQKSCRLLLAALLLPCCEQMSVTLHTTAGDLKLELFCDEVPRTAENFLALCASGYYDSTKFHRRAVESGEELLG